MIVEALVSAAILIISSTFGTSTISGLIVLDSIFCFFSSGIFAITISFSWSRFFDSISLISVWTLLICDWMFWRSCSIFLILSLSVFLILKSLEENVVYFISPTEIKNLVEIDSKKKN